MAASPYPTTPPWLRPPPLMGLLGLLLLACLSPSSIPLVEAGAEAAGVGVLRQVVGGDDGGGGTFFEPFNVTYDHRALILGGKRRMLVSAGLHYPRATPEMWPSLIAKAKEGGVDVIETYIFWNGHEQAKGQYYFEGRFDIVRFAKLVAAEGLFLFLRIGPYACAEWNFGGFPVWLRDIPGIEFRTDNEPYKAEMQNFVTKIVDIMKEEKLYSWQGGPIILQQILPALGLQSSTSHEISFADCWLKATKKLSKEMKKGLITVIILGAWILWKHHNSCVFDGAAPRISSLL